MKFAKVILITNLAISSLYATENLEQALLNIKLNGEIRSIYMAQSFNLDNNQPAVNPNANNSAFALGGNLAAKTDNYYGTHLGARFFTSQVLASSAYFGGNPANPTVPAASLSKDFLNMGVSPGKSYSTLGEAFAKNQFNKNTITLGRQEFNSPLLEIHDSYMIPNLFQGVVLTNKNIADTAIIASYLNGMQGGTTGSSRATSNPQTSFNSLSSAALGAYVTQSPLGMNGATIGNEPLYILGIESKMLDNTDLRVWYYNNIDVLQALFGEVRYHIPLTQNWKFNLHAHYYNMQGQGTAKTFFADSNISYSSTAPIGSNLTPVQINKIDYDAASVRVLITSPHLLTAEFAASFIGGASNTAYLPNIWGGEPNYARSEYLYMSSLVSYAGLTTGANARYSNDWRFALTQDLNYFNFKNNTFMLAYSTYNFAKSQNNGLDFNTQAFDIVFISQDSILQNLFFKAYFEKVLYNDAMLWGNVKDTNIVKLKAIYKF